MKIENDVFIKKFFPLFFLAYINKHIISTKGINIHQPTSYPNSTINLEHLVNSPIYIVIK